MSFGLSLMVMVGVFATSLGLNLSSVAMLSGHALSQQTSLRRLRRLIWSFWLGVVGAYVMLLSTVVLFVAESPLAINTGAGLIANHQVWQLALVGLAVQGLIMLFCKVLHPQLVNPWAPAIVRDYLRQRCTKTNSIIEAIGLGLMSVLANISLLLLPFILLAISLLSQLQVFQIVLFALASSLPVVLIAMLVAQQVKISRIQLFLIEQANFLQFVSFFSLIILGIVIACFKLSGDF